MRRRRRSVRPAAHASKTRWSVRGPPLRTSRHRHGQRAAEVEQSTQSNTRGAAAESGRGARAGNVGSAAGYSESCNGADDAGAAVASSARNLREAQRSTKEVCASSADMTDNDQRLAALELDVAIDESRVTIPNRLSFVITMLCRPIKLGFTIYAAVLGSGYLCKPPSDTLLCSAPRLTIAPCSSSRYGLVRRRRTARLAGRGRRDMGLTPWARGRTARRVVAAAASCSRC